MRLFVAVPIPDELAARVRALMETLRPLATLRWSLPADLHVTTKFIGEQPPARVPDFVRALGEIASREPFQVAVRGLGWFPDGKAPRVFWAGVDAGVELALLAADTERALAALGVAIERRAYAPHLTLARVSPGARLEALRDAIQALASTDFGAFTTDRFALYESRPAMKLEKYQPVATFRFEDVVANPAW